MADSNARYLHADRMGSIVAITSNTGALIGRNTYDEHGIPGGTNLGRFQYTGQVWLDGLGIYYYKARMYSPTIGRFMQTDPIGYADGMNLYAYVGNDPVNGVDPTGLKTCTGSRINRPDSYDCNALYAGTGPSYSSSVTPTAGFDAVFRADASDGGGGSGKARSASGGSCGSNATVIVVCGSRLGAPASNIADYLSSLGQQSDCSGGLQPVVLVPDGDTVGGDPSKSGNRYVTDLRGGYAEAMALFTAISRLNNQAYVDSPGLGDMFSGGVFDRTLAISHNPHTGARGAVRLRYGPDFRNPGQGQWKVDIARGANPNLNAAETVHFRPSSRNRSPICPTS